MRLTSACLCSIFLALVPIAFASTDPLSTIASNLTLENPTARHIACADESSTFGWWSDEKGVFVYLELGSTCGWLGTVLGLLMTQMPSRRSFMVVSILCSLAQCMHFGLLGRGGRTGLASQAIMFAMSILAYFQSEGHGWSSTAYWLLYPAVLISGGAPLVQNGLHRHQNGPSFLTLVLPLVATLLSVRARQLPDMFWTRVYITASTLPWIPYCIAVQSWSNLLGFNLFLLSSISALIQFHGFPKVGVDNAFPLYLSLTRKLRKVVRKLSRRPSRKQHLDDLYKDV